MCDRTLVRVALGLVVGWAGVLVAAQEKPAAPTPEQLREALKGFKGFIAGDVVKREKAGVVLFVRSLTLVEGNTARNAGVALGQELAVRYTTEKDERGIERPRKALTSLMQNLEKFPVFMLGGPLGGNVMIMGDGGVAVAGAAGGGDQGGVVRMEVNGARIQLGGDPDEEREKEKAAPPRGPLVTLRVKAQEDGTLVADRAVPGMQPAATWHGMPKVTFGEAKALELAPEPAEPKKEQGKDAQF